MDIGFETTGNATLICHDREPILVTDPWLCGNAYFGSWGLSHEIPAEQIDAIKRTKFAWISHGHPDHLSAESLDLLKGATILLPDHVGGRILHGLREQGFKVDVLRDRRWFRLSDRIRILCISDYNQDGILLVDINGRLLINLNDASDQGWGPFVRNIIRPYNTSILLSLQGYGDSDMINLHDETGVRIVPWAAAKNPVGKAISNALRFWGAKYFVPFSSMHRYQRSDSIWADEFTTRLPDYSIGFDPGSGTLLPAFVRYDCCSDTWEKCNPTESPRRVFSPEQFGDNWSEQLDATDEAKLTRYFRSISHLERHWQFINFRVGGQEHCIEFASRSFRHGLTFEAPRQSLMIAMDNEIFDDLLIGNFMKTTLHGHFDFPQSALYPDFTPYVTKYADNGLAKSPEQLREYFAAYRKRAPIDYLRHRLHKRSVEGFRSVFHNDWGIYRLVKRAYRAVVSR